MAVFYLGHRMLYVKDIIIMVNHSHIHLKDINLTYFPMHPANHQDKFYLYDEMGINLLSSLEMNRAS